MKEQKNKETRSETKCYEKKDFTADCNKILCIAKKNFEGDLERVPLLDAIQSSQFWRTEKGKNGEHFKRFGEFTMERFGISDSNRSQMKDAKALHDKLKVEQLELDLPNSTSVYYQLSRCRLDDNPNEIDLERVKKIVDDLKAAKQNITTNNIRHQLNSHNCKDNNVLCLQFGRQVDSFLEKINDAGVPFEPDTIELVKQLSESMKPVLEKLKESSMVSPVSNKTTEQQAPSEHVNVD